MSGFSYQDDVDLDSEIEGAIDGYERSREDIWNDLEDGPSLHELVNAVADLLHRTSEQLLPTHEDLADPQSWAKLRRYVENPDLQHLIRERLQVSIGWKVAPRTGEMADRCLDITREVMAAKPGDGVLKYVRRLTTCYIAGLFPECVMICRAVVERALKDTFERRSRMIPPTPKGGSALKTLIDTAHQNRWLSDQAQSAAEQVRHRGNKAIHEDPELVANVRDTVHGAILVLRELAAVR